MGETSGAMREVYPVLVEPVAGIWSFEGPVPLHLYARGQTRMLGRSCDGREVLAYSAETSPWVWGVGGVTGSAARDYGLPAYARARLYYMDA
jgi:hypothetical protein